MQPDVTRLNGGFNSEAIFAKKHESGAGHGFTCVDMLSLHLLALCLIAVTLEPRASPEMPDTRTEVARELYMHLFQLQVFF